MSGGGAEKVLSTLLKHINKSKFDITLCSICEAGKYLSFVRNYVNCKVILPDYDKLNKFERIIYKLKYKLIYNILPLQVVYNLFIPKNNDIEIAFVEGFATKLLAQSTNTKAKKIAWVHCDMQQFHWTKSVFHSLHQEEECYQSYSQIITVSNTAKESFKNIFTNVTTPVSVLYNPINSHEIVDKSAESIPIPPKKENFTRLVSVGRYSAPKAYDRLLRIISKLSTEKYHIELWLLGDGEQKSYLRKIIKEEGLDEIVTLWGFQPNPYVFLTQCDLFVCSSISEGYSTAVTEALILELPVITTNCSGMHELLKNGECGIITENSEEDLYVGIKFLLDNPDSLVNLKQKATQRGAEFSLNKLITCIEQTIDQ